MSEEFPSGAPASMASGVPRWRRTPEPTARGLQFYGSTMPFCKSFFTAGVFVFTTLSMGCRSQAIDEQANLERTVARERATGDTVFSTCGDEKKFGPNCGLVSRKLADPDFRTKFRDKYCGEVPEEQCQTLFQRMFDAELAKRYFAADVRAVVITCDLHPTECDDPATYERYLLQSHNQHVHERLAREETAIEDARERAQAQYQHKTWEGVHAMARAVGQLVEEDRFRREGGVKCRSYPDVFTGATTYCERR
ncbi:hypothetical protein LVJ94_26350 [Pendulispora rubella]|uniref:Lipoprotein n=1 Tax=Pendulispora rubella TaxID=2741070 RepID=A0ABZ2KVU8_9BACT